MMLLLLATSCRWLLKPFNYFGTPGCHYLKGRIGSWLLDPSSFVVVGKCDFNAVHHEPWKAQTCTWNNTTYCNTKNHKLSLQERKAVACCGLLDMQEPVYLGVGYSLRVELGWSIFSGWHLLIWLWKVELLQLPSGTFYAQTEGIG